MSNDGKDRSDFVRQVRDTTNRFLAEVSEENEVLRQHIEILECDKHLLKGKLSALEEELQAERRERKKVAERIETMEKLRASTAAEYAAVEDQNNSLASLYTATYSLHGTLDHEELIRVIKEIIANLIGSEEMGIFLYAPDTRELELIGSLGLDTATFASIPADSGFIGESIRRGRTVICEDTPDVERSPYEEYLTASIPLCVDGTVHGAIAVFRLLQHKRGIEALDRELFDLLGCQAAVALYASRLHRSHGSANPA